jgi:hypothetical protein
LDRRGASRRRQGDDQIAADDRTSGMVDGRTA